MLQIFPSQDMEIFEVMIINHQSGYITKAPITGYVYYQPSSYTLTTTYIREITVFEELWASKAISYQPYRFLSARSHVADIATYMTNSYTQNVKQITSWVTNYEKQTRTYS